MRFIKFFVDSQAALMALDKSNIRSIQVRDTCRALDKLGGLAKVSLVWTRAHVGTSGNERADHLAKAGSSSGVATMTPIPHSHRKAIILEKVVEIWDSEWLNILELARQSNSSHQPVHL